MKIKEAVKNLFLRKRNEVTISTNEDNENKYHFQKLTPKTDTKTEVYDDAINYVFSNNDLKNIALSGAYGAGKSSVLKSYKEKPSNKDKRFLHISLAHFRSEDDEHKGISAAVTEPIKESVLEWKILNQLIHQITPMRIPQTNFRIKRKISSKMTWLYAICSVVLAACALHILFFDSWKSYVNQIYTDWAGELLLLTTTNTMRFVVGVLCLVIVAALLQKIIKLQLNRGIFRRVSKNGFEVEMFEQSEDSYFDKYLNEVLYLFNNCDADVIVFEDMDRYNVNRIFERLHEVNRLINAQRSKTGDSKPLRFFYLLKDDIFLSKDRTKFFDFIIPIVPVIDSSNAHEQFITHLKSGGIWELFKESESFLHDISLYIDDMRILKNIYNEYRVYYHRLNTTELSSQKMLAMIVYKNLFPRDFSDLQLRRGFVFALFDNKAIFAENKSASLKRKLDEAKRKVEYIQSETLESIKELDLVDANNKKEIDNKYPYRSYQGYNDQKQNHQNELNLWKGKYQARKEAIENIDKNKLPQLNAQIERIEGELVKIKNETLRELITRENIEEIFAVTTTNDIGKVSAYEDVRGNAYFDMLKYLIREGYIDETYSDYMTYFYAGSISNVDKIFLRSITDQSKKEFSYQLQEPEKVFERMGVTAFSKLESLNFDLLSYMLENQDVSKSAVELLFEQIKSTERFDFIQEAVEWIVAKPDKEATLISLVTTTNFLWSDFLHRILSGAELANECRDRFLLLTLYHSITSDLKRVNIEDCLTEFISGCSDFLNINEPNIDKIIKGFGVLGVKFDTVNYEESNTSLFEAVYENSFYALTFANISQMLSVVYGIAMSDDYKHKNYTLVMSDPISPLAEYANENIIQYLTEVLANCEGHIKDDEQYAMMILNNEEVPSDTKKSYISVSDTVINELSKVDDETLWKHLIEKNLVVHSEQNVIKYYLAYDRNMTDELVAFINSSDHVYNFVSARKQYSDEDQSAFFLSVLQCSSIKNSQYKNILSSLERVYSKNGFGIEGIKDDKMLILIDIGVIKMLKESLVFIREHYPNVIPRYISRNIEEYINLLSDEEVFEYSEALSALKLSEVSESNKIKITEHTNEAISLVKHNYSDGLAAYIIKNNFFDDDLPILLKDYSKFGTLTKGAICELAFEQIDSIFVNEHLMAKELFEKLMTSVKDSDTKLKLLSMVLPIIDEVVCKQYLSQYGIENYGGLFYGKRPKFPINDIHDRLLSIFQDKDWITKFEVDEKDEGFYRAVGRKKSTSLAPEFLD